MFVWLDHLYEASKPYWVVKCIFEVADHKTCHGLPPFSQFVMPLLGVFIRELHEELHYPLLGRRNDTLLLFFLVLIVIVVGWRLPLRRSLFGNVLADDRLRIVVIVFSYLLLVALHTFLFSLGCKRIHLNFCNWRFDWLWLRQL